MKTFKDIMACAAVAVALTGCVDLDIPPKNILTNDDIYNEGGITAYMAGLYNRLPMEDFNMGDDGGRGGFFDWLSEKPLLAQQANMPTTYAATAVCMATRDIGKMLTR